MGRKASFQGSSKPVAAAAVQTVVFTPTDIESAGCVQLMFQLFGNAAPQPFSGIDRIRVRAGGDVIWDSTREQLQAYQQRWSNRFSFNADTEGTFSIPLNFLDAPRGMSGEHQDRCQFPPNREIQVEIVTLATVVVGSIVCGWKQTDIPAEFFPRYYSNVLNLPAGSRNVKYTFAEPGIVRGFTLPTAGVDRVELYISDRTAFRLPGSQFGAAVAANTGDMSRQKDFFECGQVDLGPAIGTTQHIAVDLGIPALAGSSYLLMDTIAGGATPWLGVTNEGVIYSIVQLARR
jgi:hypothetical protein